MRTSFAITATVEGNLDEVINSRAVSAPSLQEVLDVLGQLAFVAETAAHLHGVERSVLPYTDKAREVIAALQPRIT
jgi:hypothetical protein